MNQDVRKELRRLRYFTYGTTAVVVILGLAAFTRTTGKAKFDEIDVGRINVVEKDGKLRLVISNRDRSPGPIAYGKPFGYPGGSRPGMIFFNDEGTENGGLTFTGKRNADGTYSSSGHLSFDQFNEDQVVYLQYLDDNGRQRKGLTVADRADIPILDLVAAQDSIQKMPEGPAKAAAMKRFLEPKPGELLFAPRVFLGRDPARTAMLILADRQGKTRLRLAVDSLGRASLDFLDADGKVMYSLPDSARFSR
jgi:hypothetical protein